MIAHTWEKPVSSLVAITIRYILNNLAIYGNEQLELLKLLPPHIRNRMLKAFTTSPFYWEYTNFKNIFCAMLNDNTYNVNLTLTSLDDEILNVLSKCQNIRKLYLTTTRSTDITTTALLNVLKSLNDLLFLVLRNCDEVNDNVLECLSQHCHSLTVLDVGGCKNLTDTGIKNLATLENLTSLSLSHTQMSDEGILFLTKGKSGRKIKELRINNCLNITDKGIKAVAMNCSNIEILIFHNCSANKDLTISTLEEGNLKSLKELTWTITW